MPKNIDKYAANSVKQGIPAGQEGGGKEQSDPIPHPSPPPPPPPPPPPRPPPPVLIRPGPARPTGEKGGGEGGKGGGKGRKDRGLRMENLAGGRQTGVPKARNGTHPLTA